MQWRGGLLTGQLAQHASLHTDPIKPQCTRLFLDESSPTHSSFDPSDRLANQSINQSIEQHQPQSAQKVTTDTNELTTLLGSASLTHRPHLWELPTPPTAPQLAHAPSTSAKGVVASRGGVGAPQHPDREQRKPEARGSWASVHYTHSAHVGVGPGWGVGEGQAQVQQRSLGGGGDAGGAGGSTYTKAAGGWEAGVEPYLARGYGWDERGGDSTGAWRGNEWDGGSGAFQGGLDGVHAGGSRGRGTTLDDVEMSG